MKKLSLFLVLALMLTSLAGFTANADVDPSTLEPYTIKWYSVGEKADNTDVVVEKINEYLTEHLNAKLDLILNTADGHIEKLKLLTASREAFDLAFVSNDYPTFVAQEAFAPLKDLLNEYGPDIMAQYPSYLWDSVTIGGEVYAIPTHKYSCAHQYVGINIDLSNKAGVDTSWISNADLSKSEKWEAFKTWAYAMKESGVAPHDYICKMTNNMLQGLYPVENIGNGVGSVVLGDGSYAGIEHNIVFNHYATPEFKQWCEDSYAMNQAGITPTDKDTKIDVSTADPAFDTQDSMAKRVPGYIATYGYEIEPYFLSYAFLTTDKIYGSMNAISDTSADPARTMMFVNALIADKELANMVFYGLEDQDYTRTEEGQIKLNNPKTYNMTTWALPGFLTAEPDTSLPVDMVARYEAFADELVPADNLGFALDEDPILTEMAAIRQVREEYAGALVEGRSNPEENLPKFLDALNAAGAEAAIAEMQRQLDEWRTIQGYEVAAR